MFRFTLRLLATALTLLQAHSTMLALLAAAATAIPQAYAGPTASTTATHTKSQRPPANSHYARRNLDTISRIYNLTVYPNQLPIFQAGGGGVPAGLFSQDVVGRVDPVGNFTGFEHSIEYFFALSPLPQGNAAGAAITGYKIASFSSQCKNVAASVVYLYCGVVEQQEPEPNPPKGCGGGGRNKRLKVKKKNAVRRALPPLKQVAFWRFDEEGAVLKYDAWIPNLNSWVEATTAAHIGDAGFRAESIRQICMGTQARCTGANRQWDSVDECVAALEAKKYGTYDEAWGDNVVCRSIHLVLTQVRPDVHCPHVGRTGGGKCVDVPYPENYFSDEALYGEPAGETFMCD